MEPLLPSGGLTALPTSAGGGATLLLLTPTGGDGAQALVRIAQQGVPRIEVTVVTTPPVATPAPLPSASTTSLIPGAVPTTNPATPAPTTAASPRGTVQVALGDGGRIDLRGWDGPPLPAGTRLTLQLQPQGDGVGLRLLAINGRPLGPAFAAAPPAPAAA
ncbi:hypothetical protein, partial [Phaeospirillum tilakii]